MLTTGEDFYGARTAGVTAPVNEVAEATESIPVIVNDGRWMALCPTPGCGGAQVAFLGDPRFWCHYCGNERVGGRWLRVTWPRRDARERIEALLVVRPLVNRHWTGEPIRDLAAENERHGVS